MSDKKTVDQLYTDTQRKLVGALMYDSDSISRVLELITFEDVEEPTYSIIFNSMAELFRKDEPISAVTVAEKLQNKGQLANVGGTAGLYKLETEGRKYCAEANPIVYARIIKESSAKSKISKELVNASDKFKEDSGIPAVDAVSELQSTLNDTLLHLSDASTASKISDEIMPYQELLLERKENSEAGDDDLQGIPTPLNKLNQYTRGWQKGQLITVGAKTGIGKALDITTPILTCVGWKTMGNIQVGDKVLGTDYNWTTVTNVTDVMYDHECYRIVFNTGEMMVADAEHQWAVVDSHGNHIVITTAEMSEHYENYRIGTMSNMKVRNMLDNITGATLGQKEPNDTYLEGKNVAAAFKLDNSFLSYRTTFEPHYADFQNKVVEMLSADFEEKLEFVDGFLTEALTVDSVDGLYLQSAEFNDDLVMLLRSVGLGVTVESSGWLKIVDDFQYSIVDMVKTVSVPVKCIEVDATDHMFLAGETFVPTHNSVFAVNCATAAMRNKSSVMFFSLEMGKEEIEDRIFASMGGIPLDNLRKGKLTDEDKENLGEVLTEVKDYELIIDIEPKMTVDTIRARALRQAQSEKGLDLIIVDYLQLLTNVGRFGSRQEQVADMSRNMKLLAKQLKVPIIVLVQMNRQKSEDESAMPNLDQIRESGAIAQDSDIVILLHRDKTNDSTTPKTAVMLEKNRNGKTNQIIWCHSLLGISLFKESSKADELGDKIEEELEIEDDDSYGFDDTEFDDDFEDFDLDEDF